MHLHGSLLERYRRGELSDAELAAVDTHVSNCLFCAHALADEAVASVRWARRGWLGRLVRVDEPTPAAEPAGELGRAA